MLEEIVMWYTLPYYAIKKLCLRWCYCDGCFDLGWLDQKLKIYLVLNKMLLIIWNVLNIWETQLKFW
jgi:hypothetical protein